MASLGFLTYGSLRVVQLLWWLILEQCSKSQGKKLWGFLGPGSEVRRSLLHSLGYKGPAQNERGRGYSKAWIAVWFLMGHLWRPAMTMRAFQHFLLYLLLPHQPLLLSLLESPSSGFKLIKCPKTQTWASSRSIFYPLVISFSLMALNT